MLFTDKRACLSSVTVFETIAEVTVLGTSSTLTAEVTMLGTSSAPTLR